MAKAPKNKSASALTLAMIVAATQSETGFLYASAEAAAPFLADGTAEQNTGVVNPANANEFALRATSEGIAKVATPDTNTNQPAATAPAKPTFIRKMIEAPAKKPRGGGGVNIYPFDDLVAPVDGKQDAFFVAATAEKPKPWESLQSAVSAATRRYATKTGEKSYGKADGSTGTRAVYNYTRKFVLSEGEDEGVKGAWVSRSQ